MYRFFFYLIFLLICFEPGNAASSQNRTFYQLSVCTLFFNEASCLKEWIEFHRLVGVDHFYLYNNNSDDHYLEVLQPYIEKGIVEVIDWPSPPEKNWTAWQRMANNHCLKRCRKESEWIAFIDTDEYILPLDCPTLPQFLKKFKKYGGVYIYWQNYGTSFLSTLPEGGLMAEHLTLKYRWDHFKNFSGKSIVQPKRVKFFWIHTGDYHKGYYAVTSDKKRMQLDSKALQIDRIRINHYWTRAEDFFYQVKIPRLERATGKKVSQEEIERIQVESNEIEDLTIFRWIPDLKKAMNGGS